MDNVLDEVIKDYIRSNIKTYYDADDPKTCIVHLPEIPNMDRGEASRMLLKLYDGGLGTHNFNQVKVVLGDTVLHSKKIINSFDLPYRIFNLLDSFKLGSKNPNPISSEEVLAQSDPVGYLKEQLKTRVIKPLGYLNKKVLQHQDLVHYIIDNRIIPNYEADIIESMKYRSRNSGRQHPSKLIEDYWFKHALSRTNEFDLYVDPTWLNDDVILYVFNKMKEWSFDHLVLNIVNHWTQIRLGQPDPEETRLYMLSLLNLKDADFSEGDSVGQVNELHLSDLVLQVKLRGYVKEGKIRMSFLEIRLKEDV